MENVKKIEKVFTNEEWSNALEKSFKKNNKEVKIDGFRQGNAPKNIFIKKYGIESLYNDAVDFILEENYSKIIIDSKLEPVIQPTVDIKDISEEKLVLEFTIITKPEVKLGEYKDLKIKKEKVKVTEEDIKKEIKDLTSKYAEIVVKETGKIENGDTAIINFKGIVDGKELEGGSGENYPLEIGSHTFIPGFEEGLVGMEKGEEKVLKLTFPENYTEELKNKDVDFTVVVNEIKTRVLPELNKEFFEDLAFEGVDSVETFNAKVKEIITNRKENEINTEHTKKCLEKAVENMTVELNDEIIDDEIHRMIHNLETQLSYQGVKLDDYMKFTGTTHEDLHKQMHDDAVKRIKERYLLESVVEAEKIDVTDEDVDARAQELANNYGMEKEDLINEIGGLDMVKYDSKMQKAFKIICE